MIALGEVVNGYRFDGMLGEGGMGVVFEATQLSLGRPVAVKVLRDGQGQDEKLIERLRREGRMQAAIDHPNIVEVFDVIDSPKGTLLVMRLVRGRTLSDLIRERVLGADQALALMGQVADALDRAHEAGLVHRDVKPRNILVGENGRPYLADFGLTRTGQATSTLTGSAAGTLAYMAPEVIRGEPATPASDRYAFTATLYECLAGDVVFPRPTDAAVLYAHSTEDPPPLSERRPELPTRIDAVLTAGLAKDPAARPSTATQIVEAAAAAFDETGADATAVGPPPPSTAQVADTVPPRPSHPPAAQPPRRRRTVITVGVAAAVVGAVVSAFALGRGGSRDPITSEPAPAVPAGAQELGSGLTAGRATSVACQPPAVAVGKPCSFVQELLPGRLTAAPQDGAIFGWEVRGAQGQLALQIVRPRAGKMFQVARSQYVIASDPGVQHYSTNLPISKGDLIGLEVIGGARVGTRTHSGAAVAAFRPALTGFDTPPTTGPASEILVRADYYPGAAPHQPRQLNGVEAAKAPAGQLLHKWNLRFPNGTPVSIEMVRLTDGLAMDEFRGASRVARVYPQDIDAAGRDAGSAAFFSPGSDEGEVDVFWINPNTSLEIMHYFGILPTSFDFWS